MAQVKMELKVIIPKWRKNMALIVLCPFWFFGLNPKWLQSRLAKFMVNGAIVE